MAIVRILTKVIVSPFYQQNTGFFLFVFYFMFGIVPGNQLLNYHVSLMLGISTSSTFMAIAFLIWALYLFKCTQFWLRQFHLPQHSFLTVITGQPLSTQFTQVAISMVLLLLPALCYAVAAAIVGLSAGRVLLPGAIILFSAAMPGVSSLIVVRSMTFRRTWRITFPNPFTHWKKPISLFYIAFVFNDLKLMFFVTKAFSYLVLLGFLQIEAEDTGSRVVLLGLLFCLFAHAVLVFEFRKWEDSYLLFFKNLPISPAKSFTILALVYFLIFIPEFALLAVNGFTWYQFPGAILLCVSSLLLLHCQLFVIRMHMDTHIQRITMLFIISFAVVLFNVYWVIPAISLPVAYGWFYRNYYSFEPMRL